MERDKEEVVEQKKKRAHSKRWSPRTANTSTLQQFDGQ